MDYDLMLVEFLGINCEFLIKDFECINIEILENDVIFRLKGVFDIEMEWDFVYVLEEFGKFVLWEYINSIIVYIDVFNVYGLSEEEEDNFRVLDGLLKIMKLLYGCFLGDLLFVVFFEMFCEFVDLNIFCFLVGDECVNEN